MGWHREAVTAVSPVQPRALPGTSAGCGSFPSVAPELPRIFLRSWRDAARARPCSSSPLEILLLPEWEVESLEQCSALAVVHRRRRNRDVHPPDLVHLVVLDLGENDLFLDTQAVVALTVERARRDAAEVADARH